MIQVRIDDIDATAAIRIVHELRDMGWQQGEEFDFAYRQAQSGSYSYEVTEPSYAIFFFRQEMYATTFRLKYL